MTSITVTPIAFESLGVRASCILVKTPEIILLLDAGLSVAPRFSMIPHPQEYRALISCRRKIAEAAEKADIITISHYHNDHYTPSYLDTTWLGSSLEENQKIYSGKLVLAKDWRLNINPSQRRRGWLFQKSVTRIAKELRLSDGKEYVFGETKLRFSVPVFHGEENTELGWVVMLTVERAENRFMYASDVQGPMSEQTRDIILNERPTLLTIGGQPLYLSGTKIQESSILRAYSNLTEIVRKVPITILDHHILRAEDWRLRSDAVFQAAEMAPTSIVTAAEYIGCENNLLESKRRSLYENEPPSEAFMRWGKMPTKERQKIAPPI